MISDEPEFFTVRQVVAAFLVGYLEQSVAQRTVVVPRFAESVCQQLGRYLQSCQGNASDDDTLYLSPADVGVLLLDFSRRHAVVREWPLDHDAACANAAAYLATQVATTTAT